ALLVEMGNDLGIAAGAEAMAGAQQVLAERAVVVDLAVADDLDVTLLVGERLRAVRDVDDGEAPAAEPHPAPDHGAVAVGTAMDERAPHPTEHRRVRPEGATPHEAIDPAHHPTSTGRHAPGTAWRSAAAPVRRCLLRDRPGTTARALFEAATSRAVSLGVGVRELGQVAHPAVEDRLDHRIVLAGLLRLV